MNKTIHSRSAAEVLLTGGLMLLALSTGCKNHLAFGTATTFGLDISQKPDQTIEVTMGYRRAEMASIPVAPAGAAKTADADGTNDAYSVLGRFKVTYGNPWGSGPDDGLHLRQFFATGMAARKAAANVNMQKIFGQAAYEVNQTNKPANTNP